MLWTMNDKEILKLKFGLAAISVMLLLTGSRLLFDGWTSIDWSFWFILGLIIYAGVYPIFKSLKRKDTQIVFNKFDFTSTIPLVGIIALGTIMLLIFYPLISFLLFGLGLATLSIVGGLKFIIFDKGTVVGLFGNSDLNLKQITTDIQADKIEIRTLDNEETLLLKRGKYSDRVWKALINNFTKIKSGM